MLKVLQQWIKPPTFENLHKTQVAGLLHIILLLSLTGGLCYLLLSFFLGQGSSSNLAMEIIVLLLLAFVMMLLRRGRVVLAARLFVVMLWSIFTIWTVVLQGLSGSTYMAYLFVILVAAYTIDFRFAIGITTLSLAVVLIAGIAEQQGILPLMPAPLNIMNTWVASALIFTVSVVMIQRITATLVNALSHAQQSAQALKRMNRAYQVLSAGNQSVVRASDEASFLQDICDILVNQGAYALAWIDIQTDEGQATSRVAAIGGGSNLDVAAAQTLTGADLPLADAPGAQVYRNRPAADNQPDYRSILTLALKSEADVYGVLHVCSLEADIFAQDEVALLQELASDVAFAISTLRARDYQQQIEADLRYHAGLLDQVSDVIVSRDQNLLIRSWNRAAELRYGVPASQAIGRLMSDFMTTEYIDVTRQQVYRSLAEEGSWEGEIIQRLPDSSNLYVQVILTSISDDNGNIIGSVGISRDITARKLAEEALRVSRERLQTFLESTTDGILIFDADLSLVEVNAVALEPVGKRREDWIGKSIHDLLPNTIESGRYQLYQQVMQTGEALFIENAFIPLAEDSRIVQIKAFKVGDGLGLVTTDVTERRQIEHERERFFALSADILIVVGFDTHFKRVNPAFEMTLGWRIEDLEDVNALDLVHPDDRAEAERVLARLAQGEAVLGFDVRYRRKDGSYLWLNWNDVPYLEENAIFAVARDVTQMKAAQQALIENGRLEAELLKERELSELKNWFMSLVSHEFRTPMTIIQSSTEIIRRYSDRMSDDVRERHLNHIISQVGQLNAMLSDYSLVLYAQDGRLEFQPTPQNVVDFCRNLVDEYRLTTHSQHDLRFECDEAIGIVQIDARFLGYTVRNLLSNAIKYSPDGGEVSFSLGSAQDQLIIKVSDQGIGIPAKALDQIFDSYHRAGNVGEIHGTGIGLNIARLCVESHGGQIEVSSKVGEGSTFTVTLPLVPAFGPEFESL